MRRIFVVAVATFVVVMLGAVDVMAQSVETKRAELSVRTMDGAHVLVRESSDAHSAVTTIESRNRTREVNGYRVVIFSDNGQYAGDNAKKVLETFRKNYPHINAYLVFESPYFKVSVGDCLTLEEASHLMSQLEGEYREPFPKQEVIKLSDLANVRPDSREVPDSLHKEHPMTQVVQSAVL